MRRAAALLSVAALLSLPVMALAAEQFDAKPLTPEAEVPPADSDGSGFATVTISDDEASIDYEVTFEGLTGPPAAAHIHFGGPDVAGPVMIPLEHGPSPFSGTFNEADYEAAEGIPATWAEALDAIRNGNAYINVHTEANPPGEIRGQLELSPPDTAVAASDSPATGSAPVLLLVLIGLAAFLVAFRRFSFRRA